MMIIKPSTWTFFLLNKFFIINCILFIAIFMINTFFFNFYNFKDRSDSYNGITGNKQHIRTSNLHGFSPRHAGPQVPLSGDKGDDHGDDKKPYQLEHSTRKYERSIANKRRRMSDSWIVVKLKNVNTSSGFLQDGYLSFLDAISGWVPVIVGEAVNSNHGCKTCLQFNNSTLQNSARPVLDAIITGINNGARRIFVMTSLHDVGSALKRMTSPKIGGVIYSGKVPFKPCSHFVQPLLSAGRSFLDCYDSNWVYSYSTGEFPERQVTGMCQECGNVFPQISNGYLYCDRTTPDVAVKPGTLATSLFENSLWSHDSFWALFFYGIDEMSSVPTETLKLSYIVQRLLWEIHISLSFIRSHDLGFRNVTYSNETKEQQIKTHDVYSKLCRERGDNRFIYEIIRSLYAWKCNENLAISECVKILANALLNSKYISQEQNQVIHEFMARIDKAPYTNPNRTHRSKATIGSYVGTKTKMLRFWPSAKHRSWSQSPFHSYCSRFNVSNNSSSSGEKLPISENKSKSFLELNIVLVIVFKSNDPARHIQMVNFYDFMYGRHFRHIVYCTTGTEMIEMFSKMYPQPMTVIDLKVTNPKLFSYICISEVMRMSHHSVRGYLHIDSDTLFNPWSIQNLDVHLDKPWFNTGAVQTKLYEMEVKTPARHISQMWRDRVHGRRAMNNSMQDLLFISRVIDRHINNTNSNSKLDVIQYLTKYNRIVKRFLADFKTTRLSHFEVWCGIPLVYYIPVRYKEEFILLSDEFSRYHVHADIVIPTIIKTLDPHFVELNGTISSTSHTSAVLESYKPYNVFLYPWEMHLMPSPQRTQFMCNTYLPQLEYSLMQSDITQKGK